MAKYSVPLTPGTYDSDDIVKSGPDNDTFDHQLSFKINGSPTGGTLQIQTRSPGSDTYENVPNGMVDLTAIQTVLFQFKVRDYRFIVAGTGVTSGEVVVSDISFDSVGFRS